jgi:hypothetical protein
MVSPSVVPSTGQRAGLPNWDQGVFGGERPFAFKVYRRGDAESKFGDTSSNNTREGALMDEIRLTPQYEKLVLFEDVWEGEERVAPSPWAPASVARGRVAYRREVAGIIIVQDYTKNATGGP